MADPDPRHHDLQEAYVRELHLNIDAVAARLDRAIKDLAHDRRARLRVVSPPDSSEAS